MPRHHKFAWIDAVYAEPRFTPADKAILSMCALRGVHGPGESFNTRQQTIATNAGVGIATVKRALAKARAIGFLATQRAPRGRGLHDGDVHRLTYPNDLGINLSPETSPSRDQSEPIQGSISNDPGINYEPETATDQPEPRSQGITQGSIQGFNGYLENASYVSSAHARNTELAMSERNDLSPPVSIGATRLVAAIIGDKIGDADRTVLRIKASEALHAGRSDDDLADCLRIWLTKPDLGPHALLCCLTEVDKRKLAGPELSTSEKNVLKAQALKARMTQKELHA